MTACRTIDLPRVLTTGLAARQGVTRSRMRTEVARGRWVQLASGVVLTRPETPTRWDWLQAAVLVAGSGSAITGWDALRLRGVVQSSALPPERSVVLTRRGRSRRLGAVLIRRTDRPYSIRTTPFDAIPLPLVPVARTARAVADAALLATSLDDVRALVARAVQRGDARPADIAAELEAGPQQSSHLLRVALEEISDGARSTAEAHALRILRASSLPPFELNVPVVDATGRVLYVVDVLWRRLRAALEIEGEEYHFERTDWQATLRRHNALTAGQLSLVHHPASTVMRDDTWLATVESWLRSRADELGHPYEEFRGRRPRPEGLPAPFALTRVPAPAPAPARRRASPEPVINCG